MSDKMDQCKHCTAREDFDKCRQTPCSLHKNWGFREAVEQAHMAGQMDAGCRHPSYSNARAYFDHAHNDSVYAKVDTERGVMKTCIWAEDAYGNWHTGCNEIHIIIDGTPSENGYVDCPYCGSKIKEVYLWVELAD
jgi:hypothetical protein